MGVRCYDEDMRRFRPAFHQSDSQHLLIGTSSSPPLILRSPLANPGTPGDPHLAGGEHSTSAGRGRDVTGREFVASAGGRHARAATPSSSIHAVPTIPG